MPTGSDIIKHVHYVHVFIQLFMSVVNNYEVIATEPEPSFGQPEVNISVVQGDMAVLPCSIKYLGVFRVAWTDATGYVLTHEDRRIFDDPRLSVERPFTKDWNLHIRDVKSSDTGKYICQINTQPVKKKIIALYVQVPPVILDDLSSHDQTVREGQTVNLTCNATGVPAPAVTWYRITTNPNRGREIIGSPGEVLMIYNVSRDCGGTYVCDAENGIDVKASRKIKVNVEYAPEVEVKSSRMGHYKGRETFLQCEVVANPHGIMYWIKDDEEIVGDTKHIVEMFSSDYDEKKILSLRIREISDEDFGKYTCFAKNKIGKDKAYMVLYDYSERKTDTHTTTSYLRPKPLHPKTTSTTYMNPDTNRNNNNVRITNGNRGNSKTGGQNFGAVKGNNSAVSSVKQSSNTLVVFYVSCTVAILKTFSRCV